MITIKDNKVNLCDSCSYEHAECPSALTNVMFGDGVGNDNICACSKYKPGVKNAAKVAKKSDFSYKKSPFIEKFEFVYNKDFDTSKKIDEIGCLYDWEINSSKETREAKVTLNIKFGNKEDKDCPFFIDTTVSLSVVWGGESDERAASVLEAAMLAHLVSYLRPIIVQMTANTPYGVFHVPFLDLSKEEEKK